MQNIIEQAPATKRDYDFIDTIRCISMIMIVVEHSIYFEPVNFHPIGFKALFYSGTIQFSKFGTICFFLLAGFLLGEKFTTYTPLQYLRRRFDNTIWPWLFWSVLFIIIVNFNLILNKLLMHPDPLPEGMSTNLFLLKYVEMTYLYTMYWFIPNFLFCIALLLVFKKYLYSYVFGAVLLMFTLFYSVNIYFSWITPSHTTAICGFVFFLWLGAILNKNWKKVNAWLTQTPLWLWVTLSIITFCIGVAETEFLKYLHNGDFYNSLRFSNILYSLSTFFMLLKIRNFSFTRFLKPRETTYGVYLIHYIIVVVVMRSVFGSFNIDVNSLSPIVLLLYQIARFLFVYSIVITLVLLINKTKLKRLIGR